MMAFGRKKDLKPLQVRSAPFLLTPSESIVGLHITGHSGLNVELFSYLE